CFFVSHLPTWQSIAPAVCSEPVTIASICTCFHVHNASRKAFPTRSSGKRDYRPPSSRRYTVGGVIAIVKEHRFRESGFVCVCVCGVHT
uniref:Uncharacterized protein n=1 Tax=Anopheles atroparvus TaxID=41427 RepID=A0AAG5DPG4_ANOAO